MSKSDKLLSSALLKQVVSRRKSAFPGGPQVIESGHIEGMLLLCELSEDKVKQTKLCNRYI